MLNRTNFAAECMHECSQGGSTLILTSADAWFPLPAVSASEGHAQAIQR